MRKVVIKEGPFVFLRNVIAMEVLASILLFGLSFLENYEQLYIHFGLTKLLRYDLFLVFSFSIFQLLYIIGLFFNWYFKYYEIRDKEIVRRTGLLFKRQKSVAISHIASVEVSQSPIERFMRHATIVLEHDNGRTTKIRNVADYEEPVSVIKQSMQNGGKKLSRTISSIIDGGEGNFIEFKETLRWDTRLKQISKDIERAVMKTLVGFLNNEGGTLLIGVNDDGKVVGLEADFNCLPKKNKDSFENHMSLLVKNMIGMKFRGYISVRFESVVGKDVCIVEVDPSHKPAYLLNNDGKEEFFVRTGNSTQPYTMSEAEEYIKSKWVLDYSN